MSEIADFANRGASLMTPRILEQMLRKLPLWKVEFAEINAPIYPHLVNQLNFLANAVEDAVEGAYKDLPYYATAQAAFALVYAHKRWDLIPDNLGTLGRADDSSVVRAVLIQNERHFKQYAEWQNMKWAEITSGP